LLKLGHLLAGSSVEEQSAKYVAGVPRGLAAWKMPLPFCYESTGKEAFFTNRLSSILSFLVKKPQAVETV
jgi:type I restriction enzyme, R subunit